MQQSSCLNFIAKLKEVVRSRVAKSCSEVLDSIILRNQ